MIFDSGLPPFCPPSSVKGPMLTDVFFRTFGLAAFWKDSACWLLVLLYFSNIYMNSLLVDSYNFPHDVMQWKIKRRKYWALNNECGSDAAWVSTFQFLFLDE